MKEPEGISLDQPIDYSADPVTSGAVSGSGFGHHKISPFGFDRLAFSVTVISLMVIGAIAGMTFLLTSLHGNKSNQTTKQTQNFPVSTLSTSGLSTSNSKLQVGQVDQLQVNGQLHVSQTLVLAPTTAPTDAQVGQIYYDRTTNTPYYYNGQAFQPLTAPTTSIGGISGPLSLGGGLSLVNSVINNTGVISIQGQTGAVNFSSGSGIAINGSTITNTGILGFSANPNQVSVTNSNGTVSISIIGIQSGGVLIGKTGGAIDTALPTGPGQCFISDPITSEPEFGSCSGAAAVTSLNSLTNAISIQGGGNVTVSDNGTDTITISAPAGGNVSQSSFTNGQLTKFDTNGNIQDSSLLDQGTGLKVSASSYYIDLANAGTTTLTVRNSSGTANLQVTGVVEADGGLRDSNNKLYSFAASPTGTTRELCYVDDALNSNCPTGGNVSRGGTATTNKLTKFNGGGNIVNSGITDDGTTISLSENLSAGQITATALQSAGALSISAASSSTLTVGGSSQVLALQGNGSSSLVITNGSFTSSISFMPTLGLTNNRTIKFPDESGTVCLQNSTNCGFAAGGGGSGVTSLNGLSGVLTLANATGNTSTITIDNASTSGKGIAQFNSTNFSVGSGIVNTAQNINSTASPTFATLNLTSGNSITLGTASTVSKDGAILFKNASNSNTFTLQSGATAADFTLYLPTSAGSTGQCLINSGSGQLGWSSCVGGGSGGGITGTGTNGKIAKFTGGQTVADSILSESGTNVSVAGTFTVTGASSLTLGTSNTNTGAIIFNNSGTANTVTLQSGATSGTGYTLTLPTAAGASGKCLGTTGSGVLVFQTCLSGSGAGGGVTSFNGDPGAITLQGTTNQVSVTGSGGTYTLATPQSIATSSSPQFAGLTLGSFNGVVKASSGVLSAGTVTLGSDTTGNYVANLGTLTGLSTTGNSGPGSTPTLSVTYGNTTGTAVQGSTTLTCPSGTGNLTGGGTVITLGTGGTCGALNTVGSPTFSGNVTIQGGGATIGIAGTTAGQLTLTAGATGAGIVLQSGVTLGTGTGDVIIKAPDSILTGGSTYHLCLVEPANCAGSGVTATSGTNHYVAVFNGANGITKGQLFDDFAGHVGVGGTSPTALFNVGANNEFQVSSTGTVLAKTSTNSTTGFQIQNASAAVLFNADTTNMRISVGSNGTAVGQLYLSGSVPAALTGSQAAAGGTYGLAIQGRYAYISPNTGTGSGANGIYVMDISKPSSPAVITQLSISYNANVNRRIKILGKYLYMVGYNGSNSTLTIYDISNPKTPVSVGSTTYSAGSATSVPSLYVKGNYAYAGDNVTPTLFVFDISNPSSPSQVTSLSIASTSNGAIDMSGLGKYLYLAEYAGTNRFQVVDISTPNIPIVASTITSTNITNAALSVFAQGRYVFVGTSAGSTYSIDVSNPVSSTVATSISAGSAQSLYAQGRYLYSGDQSGTIRIIDISDPTSLSLLSSTINGISGESPNTMIANGRYLYTGNNTGTNTFQVFDMGGEYTQQFEAGGIEADTLSVRGNTSFNSDVSIQGGTNIGGGLQVAGNSSFNINGTYTTPGTLANGPLSASRVYTVNTGAVTSGGNQNTVAQSSGSSSQTLAATVTSQSYNMLLVAVTTGTTSCGGVVTVTGVTYGGVAMTQVSTPQQVSNGCSSSYVSLWYITGAATSGNIVANFSGSTSNTAISYADFYNVNPSSPFTTSNGNTNASNSVSTSITAASGDYLVYAGSSSNNGFFLMNTGDTFRTNTTSSNTVPQAGISLKSSPSVGSNTLTLSNSTSAAMVITGAGMRPAGLIVSSAVANFTNQTCTVTTGSCTDSGNVLSLNQQNSAATGAVLAISNSGTGPDIQLGVGSIQTAAGTSSTGISIQSGTSTTGTSGTVTVSSGLTSSTGGSGAVTVTTGSASVSAATTGGLTLSTGTNTGGSASASTGSISLVTGTVPNAMGTSGSVNIDTGATWFGLGTQGAITIGTSNYARSISVGNATGATAVTIQGGTGASAVSVQSGASGTISIGTASAANTVQIGNTTGASAVNIQAGTSGASLTSTATTGNALSVVANSLTTGNALSVSSTSSVMTTGNLASISQTGNVTSDNIYTGSLLNVSRSVTANFGGSGGPVTYDNYCKYYNTSLSSYTCTFSVANQSNRLMIMHVLASGSNYTATPTVTDSAGGTVNLVNSYTNASAGEKMFVYTIIAPTAGSHTITVNYGVSVQRVNFFAQSWYNVNQSTPLGTPTTDMNSSPSNTSTLSVSSAAGEVVEDVYIDSLQNGNATASAGQTQIGTSNASTGSSYKSGSASTSMTMTATFNDYYIHFGVPIKPANTVTESINGAVANISNNCTNGTAACGGSGSVLNVTQSDATITGDVLKVTNGALGVGLSVNNSNASNSSAVLKLQNANTTSGIGLLIQDSNSNVALQISTANLSTGYNSANATLKVAKDSGTGRSINAAGTVNASGADYAEWIPWSGVKPEQGTIVDYKGSKMVVSSGDTAAFIGNDAISDQANAILVTFTGQVPVKVSGIVHAGDYLIPNADGTAHGVAPAAASLSDYFSKIGTALADGTDTKVLALISGPGASDQFNPQAVGNFSQLNVTGNFQVGGTLAVTGDATFKANIIVEGHVITASGAPIASAVTAAGSGAVVSIDGNDTTGTITITTGAAPSAGDLAKLVFSQSYGKAPHIVISASNDDAAGLRVSKGATTVTDFILRAKDAPAANTTYTFDYFIAQ